MKRKFVILNNALKDHRGHYFETSMAIAEAARAAGFFPILATHSTCQSGMFPEWLPTYPIFTTDHWMADGPAAEPDVTGVVEAPYQQETLDISAVRSGNASIREWLDGRFQTVNDVDAVSQPDADQRDDPHRPRWARGASSAVSGALHGMSCAVHALQRVGWCGERVAFYLLPPIFDIQLRRAARFLGRPLLLATPRILQPRYYPRLEQRVHEVLRSASDHFTSRSAPLEKQSHSHAVHATHAKFLDRARPRLANAGVSHEMNHALRFLRDLERLMAMAGVDGNDHVLLGTAHARELLALSMLLSRLEAERTPWFHLEFRHPLFATDPSEEELQSSAAIRQQQTMFQLYAETCKSPRVRLYTDTAELSQEYGMLTDIKLGVLPIPFRAGLIAPGRSGTPKPLTLVFLGDARDEKGFAWLPDLVERMADRYLRSGRVRFVLQATLGVAIYNPLSGPALERLRSYPRDWVELVGEDGPLSPKQYHDLVSRSDVVLLPYDRNRYRAASSGTLAEAIAAGRPAVVPANSWMSSQLPAGAGATFHDFESFVAVTSDIVNDYERYRSAAETQRHAWLVRHSPTALVTAIQDATGALGPSIPRAA